MSHMSPISLVSTSRSFVDTDGACCPWKTHNTLVTRSASWLLSGPDDWPGLVTWQVPQSTTDVPWENLRIIPGLTSPYVLPVWVGLKGWYPKIIQNQFLSPYVPQLNARKRNNPPFQTRPNINILVTCPILSHKMVCYTPLHKLVG